jgi:kinesin family protein C2/C3
MIQDLKGAIRVFCRIRPLGRTGDASETCINVAGESELATYNTRGLGQVYKFDKVFRESTQQDQIYADTQPLVRSVLDGEGGRLRLSSFRGECCC